MKKVIEFSSAIVLVALLTFSVMSFRDNDPKKQKTESSIAAKGEKHKDSPACQNSKANSCCGKQCDKTSGKCTKHVETAPEKK